MTRKKAFERIIKVAKQVGKEMIPALEHGAASQATKTAGKYVAEMASKRFANMAEQNMRREFSTISDIARQSMADSITKMEANRSKNDALVDIAFKEEKKVWVKVVI